MLSSIIIYIAITLYVSRNLRTTDRRIFHHENTWRLPVNGYRHQGEDAGANGENRDELADLAVERAERPMAVKHVDIIEGDVQGGHHGIRDAEVHEEVISNSAHPLMRQHDPYDDQVAAGRHGDHNREQKCPDYLPPPRQYEFIPQLQVHEVSVVIVGVIVEKERRLVPKRRRRVEQAAGALHRVLLS